MTSEALLLEMRHTIESNGAHCVIVFLPRIPEVERGSRSSISKSFQQFLITYRFHWIDPYETLHSEARQGRSLFFVSNEHLNAEGHALLATIIQQDLERQETLFQMGHLK